VIELADVPGGRTFGDARDLLGVVDEPSPGGGRLGALDLREQLGVVVEQADVGVERQRPQPVVVTTAGQRAREEVAGAHARLVQALQEARGGELGRPGHVEVVDVHAAATRLRAGQHLAALRVRDLGQLDDQRLGVRVERVPLLDQLPALPVDAVVVPAQDDDGALFQVVRVVERGREAGGQQRDHQPDGDTLEKPLRRREAPHRGFAHRPVPQPAQPLDDATAGRRAAAARRPARSSFSSGRSASSGGFTTGGLPAAG
jgi:hypothetical protein